MQEVEEPLCADGVGEVEVDDDISVVVDGTVTAAAADRIDLVARTHAVTKREKDVLSLLLTGLPTPG